MYMQCVLDIIHPLIIPPIHLSIHPSINIYTYTHIRLVCNIYLYVSEHTIYMYVCMCMDMYLCMCKWICTCVVCTVCMCVCMQDYVHMCMWMYIYMCIHICVYIIIFLNIYISMCSYLSLRMNCIGVSCLFIALPHPIFNYFSSFPLCAYIAFFKKMLIEIQCSSRHMYTSWVYIETNHSQRPISPLTICAAYKTQ